MKTHPQRFLRKVRHLSTAGADKPDFMQWLNAVLRDERWRAVICDWLVQSELKEIQF